MEKTPSWYHFWNHHSSFFPYHSINSTRANRLLWNGRQIFITCYMKCGVWNQMKIWSSHLLDNCLNWSVSARIISSFDFKYLLLGLPQLVVLLFPCSTASDYFAEGEVNKKEYSPNHKMSNDIQDCTRLPISISVTECTPTLLVNFNVTSGEKYE